MPVNLKFLEKAYIKSVRNPGKTGVKLPKSESKIYPEIYLFRHGETYDNRNKIFSGWRDTNLTPLGKSQALILAKKLASKNVDVCITSPLIRSKDTAKIALKYHKNVIFEEDDRVIERNYGDLMGMSKNKFFKENPKLAIKYRKGYDFPPPRGESIKMVEQRVFPFCEELVARIKKNNINVAISAHGNSMRVIRKYFEKMSLLEELTHENPLAQDYCEYVVKFDSKNNFNDVLKKSSIQEFKFIRSALAKLRFPSRKIKNEFKESAN